MKHKSSRLSCARAIRAAACAAAACGALLATSSEASANPAFYKDKTIVILSPADPGGSYDLYGRMAAAHLVKHIPGASAIVQNMPGAGGLRAINYLYSAAAKDGLTLLVPTQDAALSEALGREGVSYKIDRMNWLGRIAPSIDLSLTWHTAKVRTIDDAKRIESTMAATGPNSPTSINIVALNALIGTKFKLIQGYKSNAEMSVAMERGETDGAFATWATLKTSFPRWIEEKKINYLVVYGSERLPELPDVPAVTELATDDKSRAVLALLASTGTLGRALVTTPDVPADRVATLRKAFDDMTADPAFAAELAKLRIEFGPMSGKQLQDEMTKLAQSPPDVIARAREILMGGSR
jgi:tripartite-type tricarboxylate transporter receptor subunit TctC